MKAPAPTVLKSQPDELPRSRAHEFYHEWRDRISPIVRAQWQRELYEYRARFAGRQ